MNAIPGAPAGAYLKFSCNNGEGWWDFYSDVQCVNPDAQLTRFNSTMLQGGYTFTLPTNDLRRNVLPNYFMDGYRFWACPAMGITKTIGLRVALSSSTSCTAAGSYTLWGSEGCVTNGTHAYQAKFNCTDNTANVEALTGNCMSVPPPLGPLRQLVVRAQCMLGTVPPYNQFKFQFTATCADFGSTQCTQVGTNNCGGGGGGSSPANMISSVVAFVIAAMALILR
jgi:hypothetical protein